VIPSDSNNLKSCCLEDCIEGVTLDSVAVKICAYNLIQLSIVFGMHADYLVEA
jgi:hypothetical protein